MSDDVKRSPGTRRRAERARQTRLRIVQAAGAGFLAEGYAATTLEEIATRAGVAVQTIYFHFQNKRTLLKQVVDLAAVGDDEPVALMERPWLDQMRAAADGAGAVRVWAEVSREIYARVVPVMTVVREAAGSDPGAAELEATSKQQTLSAHRVLAEHLAERGCLRDDLDVRGAGEVLYGLVSLDLYVVFVSELGWDPLRWQEWVIDVVVRAVLGSGPDAPPSTPG